MIDLTKSGVIERPADGPGYTMRDAINAGILYYVRIPHWASGGQDTLADSPEAAALSVGRFHKQFGFIRGVGMTAEVFQHLPASRIGAAVMERCGIFPTLSHLDYDL